MTFYYYLVSVPLMDDLKIKVSTGLLFLFFLFLLLLLFYHLSLEPIDFMYTSFPNATGNEATGC